MPTRKNSLIQNILPYLDRFEQITIGVLIFGLLLKYFGLDSGLLVSIALAVLAAIFFLSAFKTMDIPVEKAEPAGMKELISWSIIPKVLSLGCAISIMGHLFFIQTPPFEGYKTPLMAGGSALCVALLILAISYLSGTRHLNRLFPVIIRALCIVLLVVFDLGLL